MGLGGGGGSFSRRPEIIYGSCLFFISLQLMHIRVGRRQLGESVTTLKTLEMVI